MSNDFIRMRPGGLALNPQTGDGVLVLVDGRTRLQLSVAVEYPQTVVIACALAKISPSKPQIHDLLEQLLQEAGGWVDRVEITTTENAAGKQAVDVSLQVNVNQRRLSFECRLSDAIILALKYDAPIEVHKFVLESFSTPLEGSEEKGREQYFPSHWSTKRMAETLERMLPEDFRYKI